MKVSIITVTYNSSENLKISLDALCRQDYKDIESIIIDGGSTDNTVEIIKEFEKNFKGTVKWVSEKDKGLFDAINKGLKMVTGDLVGCYWDEYASDHTVSQIVEAVTRDNSDGAHGDLVYMNGDKVVRYWKMKNGTIQTGWLPGHPTLYLKKSIYDQYGEYSTKYKIAGDYEFMVRVLKDHKVKLSYIPDVLVKMFYGGVSTNGLEGYKKSTKEGLQALKANHVKHPYWITFLRIIRTLLQMIKKNH